MNAAWLLAAFLPLTTGEGTLPPPPPAPLLFVRVVAPDGTKVVFRPGSPEPAPAYVPGTVLTMGAGPLGPPACPPTLPPPLFPWFDPILGPRKPLEEILPDGGDVGLRVGIGPDGKVGNLNVTDTAAEYR